MGELAQDVITSIISVKWALGNHLVIYVNEFIRGATKLNAKSELYIEWMRVDGEPILAGYDTKLLQYQIKLPPAMVPAPAPPMVASPPIEETITANMALAYSGWSYEPYIKNDPRDYGGTFTGIDSEQVGRDLLAIFLPYFGGEFSLDFIKGSITGLMDWCSEFLDPVSLTYSLPPMIQIDPATGHIPPDSWYGSSTVHPARPMPGRQLFNYYPTPGFSAFRDSGTAHAIYDYIAAIHPTTFTTHDYANEYGNLMIFSLGKIKDEYMKRHNGEVPTEFSVRFKPSPDGSEYGTAYTFKANKNYPSDQYRKLDLNGIDDRKLIDFARGPGYQGADLKELSVNFETLKITVKGGGGEGPQ